MRRWSDEAILNAIQFAAKRLSTSLDLTKSTASTRTKKGGVPA